MVLTLAPYRPKVDGISPDDIDTLAQPVGGPLPADVADRLSYTEELFAMRELWVGEISEKGVGSADLVHLKFDQGDDRMTF